MSNKGNEMNASIFVAIVAATTLVCGASAASRNYLRFTARDGSVTIGMADYFANEVTPTPPLALEWTDNPDQEPWSEFVAGTTTIALDEGESAYLRQHDPERKTVTGGRFYLGWYFTMSAADETPAATVEAGGNCQSIVDASCACDSVEAQALSYLFYNCKILVTPPEFPATRLATRAYYHIFDGCAELRTPPRLPATTLATNCYAYMFKGCTNLTTAPELPAMTLATSCYYSMFEGCTALVNPPELPARTLAEKCYYSMFYGATSLVFAPHLPASTLTNLCYASMFFGCTSLKRISVGFTEWQTVGNPTDYWVKNVVTSNGRFIKPSALSDTFGANAIPSGWSTPAVDTIQVPVAEGLSAVAVVDGQTIRPTLSQDGLNNVFYLGSGGENVKVVFSPDDGFALVGGMEYSYFPFKDAVQFGRTESPLPTVVRLSPEVSYQSAALQFDGLAVEKGAVSLSFGVRTTAALDAPDWQPATVTGVTVSPDGKTVTLTIPATAAQGFYNLYHPASPL